MAFQTIGFIGLGLIGGSIAKKMKSNQPDIKIYATAHHKETIQEAYREGLIETMICYHCLLFLTVIIFFMCPGSTEPRISASVKRYYPQRLLYHRRRKHKNGNS